MLVLMPTRSRADALDAMVVSAHHGIVATLCSSDVCQIVQCPVGHDNYMATFWTILVILDNVRQMRGVRDVLELYGWAPVLVSVVRTPRCFVIRHIDSKKDYRLVRRHCAVFVVASDLFFVASILCVFHGLYIWAGGYSEQ